MKDDYYNYDPKAENNYNKKDANDIQQDFKAPGADENTGLALASLICGIGSFAICAFCSIPAVLFGHMAMKKIKRGEASGEGMARAGLITGYIGLFLSGIAVLGIVAGVLLPALSKARKAARKSQCANNLKQIGLAMHFYANDYDNQLPPYNGVKGLDLLLAKGYVSDPKLFICPSTDSKAASIGQPLTDATCDYNYKGGLNLNSAGASIPVACDKKHNHMDGGNVLFTDGHVENRKGYRWDEINGPDLSGE